ncbi:MAG: cobalamin B12-binding domain-containing protein [Nitrospinae bacterium]|nr:cobalamin B12-binding domain-containing protein [Nitrospinota bacterium]
MRNFFFTSVKKSAPTTAELIERGFCPKNGVVDILLIFPPVTVAERYGKKTVGNSGGDLPPLGIMYIASYLREKGFGVAFMDGCALEIGPDEIADVIGERQPRCIGISATTFGFPKAVEIAKKIKSRFPGKMIVLGGAHATVAPLHPMESYDCFDLVVQGEGEITAHEILEQFVKHGHDSKGFLADRGALENIRGIVFRAGGEIIQTPERPQIADLDQLPLPARDLIPHEKYIPLPNQYRRTPLAHMVVIRGCPYSCTFCDQANTTVRASSPKRVVEEIAQMIRLHGIREISFWDDTMTYHRKWMTEFCQRMIDAKLDIVWSCYAAAYTVDPEILDLMKKAGCWNIFYGLETPDEQLSRNIEAHKKNRNREYIRQVVKWTQKAGIEVRASFMLAIPGETPEKAKEMIRFAKDIEPDYAQFSITTPFPGTKLYDEIKQGKWGRLTTEDYSEFHCWNVVFLPNGYKNKEEVWEMEREAFRSFYFRPGYIFKRILSIRSFEDIRRYWNGVVLVFNGFVFKWGLRDVENTSA